MQHFKRDLAMAALTGLALFLSSCQQSDTPSPQQQRTLRISTAHDPATLDPRLVSDLLAVTPLHMFYEGLTSLDVNGKPVPAIAESIEISPNQTRYTFKLRDALWSDKTPVTAYDFEQTWKSTLNPSIPAPNAHQLYPIKGAKAAKAGEISTDEIGVQALDAKTLVVDLESPTPYFLELAATHTFLPIPPSGVDSDALIVNGPYLLQDWSRQDAMTAVKNPQYWDAAHVTMEKIVIMPLDEHTALQMYETNQLDWAGSPLSEIPPDLLSPLREQGLLKASPAAGTRFLSLNTRKLPYNNTKIRRALALALNRKEIAEHVAQGGHLPATGLVPPSLLSKQGSFFKDNDTIRAWFLFQEGLKELKLTKDTFPTLTLTYANSERNRKLVQAIQQQWQEALGIKVNLESTEVQLFFDRVKNGDYEMGVNSWFADINDPINFLANFKQTGPTNRTGWTNSHFTALLNTSSLETDPAKRLETLLDAEQILMEQMPIIPIFHSTFNYVSRDDIAGVKVRDLGWLDFKTAHYAPSDR